MGGSTGGRGETANDLLRALARAGRTLSIEADLGATVIEDRFAAALADAERFLGIPPARRPPVKGSSDGGDGETPGAP